MNDARTVAIVGAGIAGLTLALELHARGLHAIVYEAAPELKELGVGITLLPHAMRELSELGLRDVIVTNGIENKESAFFNRFGQKIFAEPRGRDAGYEYPEIGIHRGRIHRILLEAVFERMGCEAVRTGYRLKDLEQSGEGVTLHFVSPSGERLTSVQANIAVACDGVNSAVRAKFYPDEQLAYTGINTWRGVTRRAPILGGRTYLRVGSLKTGKIVIYPVAEIEGGLQLINWVAEIEDRSRPINDWNSSASMGEAARIYDSFKFDWLDVGGLIRDADAVLEYPMVDKDPIAQWSFGRVTLMGDAAHPMYPRGSNGSAQAILDARALADLLANGADWVGALRAYEAVRAPATARVVLMNRANPPDIINIRVEELVGDRPFEDLDAIISQEELRALSDRYKEVAGFARS